MEDLAQIRLSSEASSIAKSFIDKYFFEYEQDAAKFGMSYALRFCRDEIDIESIISEGNKAEMYDANGNLYNVGGLDPDNKIATVIKELYPECTVPYRYMRILMIYGLIKLKDKLTTIDDMVALICQ